MKKTITVYGLISGVVISTAMLLSMTYLSHCNGNVSYITSMVIGYASMLIAFSLIFVGIRNFRDKQNGGTITFGKAFKIGILIALIASTMYVISWLIDYFFFNRDFMDKYMAHELADLKSSGLTPDELTEQTNEMLWFKNMYQNPFFNAMVTYMEILPVGLVVTLVSAWILKRGAMNEER